MGVRFEVVIYADGFEALQAALKQAQAAGALVTEQESIRGMGAGWKYTLLRLPDAKQGEAGARG